MSRIFVAVALSTMLLVAGGAIGIAHDNSGADSAQLDGLVEMYASGLDVAVILPFVLLVGIGLASMAVFARSA